MDLEEFNTMILSMLQVCVRGAAHRQERGRGMHVLLRADVARMGAWEGN